MIDILAAIALGAIYLATIVGIVFGVLSIFAVLRGHPRKDDR